ncbi:hypothetical protein ACSBQ3_11010 [Staphylococcus equorum]|nr:MULTISPECIES: hypothetical protein [Staphylococcus]
MKNKYLKILSTFVVVSSAAYLTTMNPEAQVAKQIQKWGHGES